MEMANNIVLGVESGSGKYLVFAQEDLDTRLFVAFNQEGIGGHSDMKSKLYHIAQTKKIEEPDLQRFSKRPEILRAFNETILVCERIPRLKFVSSSNYHGGAYDFENGIIKLHDASRDFGAPSPEVLKDLEQSLLGYRDSQGNAIRDVRVGL